MLLSKTEAKQLKLAAYRSCQEWVQQKISLLADAINHMDDSVRQESKSSAGDKYETGRAMMHLEKEKHRIQLNQALKLQKVLNQIDPARKILQVGLGALLITDGGFFYLSIGAGNIQCGQHKVIAISPISPLGVEFQKVKAGESFEFLNRKYTLLEIC